MKTSEFIDQISDALSKAQGEFKPLVKNKINPHFKSPYADLSATIEATREALSKYGLALIQGGQMIDGRLIVSTRLAHKSGQWFEDELSLKPMQDNAQMLGSAMTYGRRYAQNAMLNIAGDEDDDGNQASSTNNKEKKQDPKPAPKPVPAPRAEIYTGTDEEKRHLMKYCAIRGIETPSALGRISEALIGKPKDDIDKVIAEISIQEG